MGNMRIAYTGGMNRKIAIGFIGAVMVLLVLGAMQPVSAAWTKKAPIHINNTGGSALTDYQVMINITYDSDMNNDFSDIRVKNETSGEFVPYWIENKVNGSWCKLWFNASYIPASSWCNDTYYLYYGDASASDASDGKAVFEFFDDIEEEGDIIQDGYEVWRNTQYSFQRAVIKNGKIYVGGGTDSPTQCYLFIMDLKTGEIEKQSPAFGSRHAPDTAPVVDGNMVYCPCQYGPLVAWNTETNTLEWSLNLSIDSNEMEYDGTYLYVTTTDYKLKKVRVSDGTVVGTFDIDAHSGNRYALGPYLDTENNVLWVVGNSKLHKIDPDTMTEILNVSLNLNATEKDGENHNRANPIVVNDSYTNNEPWVIFGHQDDCKFYAYDYDGNLKWSFEVPKEGTGSSVRAVASYNPNTGYLYIPNYAHDNPTGIQGKIYVINVSDGEQQFVVNEPHGLACGRPCTISNNYLIFKTDSQNTIDYINIYDATNGTQIGEINTSGDMSWACFPIGVSEGYLVTGGTSSGTGVYGIMVYKAGEGQAVDYYPLYGANKYGYVQNGLTSYGIPQPKDWVEDPAYTGGSISRDSLHKTGSYSLKHTYNSGTTAFYRAVGTINSNVAIEFYRRAPATDKSVQTVLNQGQNHSGEKQVTNIALYEDGYIKYHNGSWQTIMPYSANTWYRFKLCNFDFSAHTFDIYIDDELKVSGASFRNPLSYFDNFEIVMSMSGAIGYTDMLLVRKYADPEPTALLGAEQHIGGNASVSVSDGSINFGNLQLNTVKNTVDIGDTQIISTAGADGAQKIEIKLNSSTVTGINNGTTLTFVTGSPGTNEIKCEFKGGDVSSYTALTDAYQTFDDSMAKDTNANLDIQLTTPSAVSNDNYYDNYQFEIIIKATLL